MDEATFGLWGQWPAWDFEKEKNICIIDLKNNLDKKKKNLAISPQILAPWTKKMLKQHKRKEALKEWKRRDELLAALSFIELENDIFKLVKTSRSANQWTPTLTPNCAI